MPLSHIVMHVSLCSSVVRQAANRDVPLRVVLTDKLDRTALDQKFAVERGTTQQAPVEFDIPFGLYRAQITSGGCSAVQFISILPGVNRGAAVSLQPGPPVTPPVPAIVEGTAPFEFSYVQPTVMVFAHTLKCNDPITDPLPAQIDVDNEPDSYYASILPTRELQRAAPVTLAVRFSDSHGGYQYLRVPLADYVGWLTKWPTLGQLNVSSGLIDMLAGKPEDTLICVKMTKITEGG